MTGTWDLISPSLEDRVRRVDKAERCFLWSKDEVVELVLDMDHLI